MQLKTISKTIKNKMEEWLKTIKDESLSKDIQKNLLVSGGSIVSLLLNEKVNDFDVYIKDRDVLLKLVQYYINPYASQLSILDGARKDEYEKEFFAGETVETHLSVRAIAIKNLKPDQVKIYVEEKNGGLKVNEGEAPERLNYTPLFFSPNAISLSNQLQIVIRFWGDNEAIHKTFDFIHATNYWTFEDGLVTNKAALETIITKQLKYQGSLYPLTSIIRMKKFVKRNWNINAGEILKILFQVSQLDLTNPDILEEQLIGVDVAYFSKLIDILRGVPKEKMTSGYLNEIIDRVFGEADETPEDLPLNPLNQ
jgi:hypothetical protein